MIAIIITIAALIALIAWACIRMAAKNEPYPCRNCQREYCDGCEYWREWTHGG